MLCPYLIRISKTGFLFSLLSPLRSLQSYAGQSAKATEGHGAEVTEGKKGGALPLCHPRENGDLEELNTDLDSRLRGNDRRGYGNDRKRCGDDREK
ncbi:MAG: hypothetical protein PHH27_02700 [Candidatus Colwellbacteria bacterium]|nr:hypothetical protein [Candidatus Colwellbacteria bacterium]